MFFCLLNKNLFVTDFFFCFCVLFSLALAADVVQSDANDPYIVDNDLDNDEQDEEFVNPTDLLCVSANTDNENHTLIVTLFDEYGADGVNSYNHHDYLLTHLPLCLELFDFNTGKLLLFCVHFLFLKKNRI
jgi:hypothetical protein